MGDGGGNSEEQIRSMEVQIRGVEEQIRGVEEEIRGLDEQIGRLAEQITGCPSDDMRKLLQGREELLRGEKAQLRDKKAQLRGEKAQLRGEEAQLRDKGANLLQGRDLGTECDWLGQKVVPPALASRAVVYPSSSNHERMYIPVKVEHWDVMTEIEEFIVRADRRKRMYNLAVTTYTQNTERLSKQGNFLMNFILVEMLAFMKKKDPQSNFTLKPEFIMLRKVKAGNDRIESSKGASASALVDLYSGNPRADFVITSTEKNALVVEVKNEGLGSDGDDPWYLHRIWTSCSCRPGEGMCWCADFGITLAHGERIIRCICELYEYMALCKVGYGVLTDSRNWYLFKRDDTGCLKISAGIKASGEPPRLLAALSYLVHTAAEDGSEFGYPTESGQIPVVYKDAPSEPSNESSVDDINDPSVELNTSSPESPRSPTRLRSGGVQLALEDISAEDLNLKKAGGVISSEGWSGCVVNGRLHGQPVALKFAHLGTERAEALLKEVVTYTKMEKLWGVFVPRLIGHGTTNNGRVVFVATELIDGVELGEVAVTREVEAAALQALAAVHACGLLHGDVSPSNIMVVWGKKPTARILDFGFSCITRDKKLQKAERMRLMCLFTHRVEYR